MYRFDHESPSFAGRLGAAHAVEIPYVFDLLDDECSHALIGDAPPQAVADTAHGAWVRFVADGDRSGSARAGRPPAAARPPTCPAASRVRQPWRWSG